MLIIGCTGAAELAKRTARRMDARYSDLLVERFPDDELRIRIKPRVKNMTVVLFQSFFGNLDDRIVETLLAGYTALNLGARKVILVAPYFPYLREDYRFEKGESVSAGIMARIFSLFDTVYIVDPHLHRFRSLAEFFRNGLRITSVEPIAEYIRKNVKNPLIIGPDEESIQWADSVARELGRRACIMKKERLSPRRVRIVSKTPKEIRGREVVIVDDIISTGRTMLEMVKKAKGMGAKRVHCVAVHGIFASDSLEKMRKECHVVTCNTLPSKVSRIDVVPEIVRALKGMGRHEEKQYAAARALRHIEHGMVIGLGSGTTMTEFVKILGKNNPGVSVVASSGEIKRVARANDIKVVVSPKRIDIAVDGADQVDRDLNLLKGKRCLAFSGEKEIDYRAKKCIIIADSSKVSRKLDKEVLVKIKKPEARDALKKLGGKIIKELEVENGDVLFLKFRDIDPKKLEKKINTIDGVVENGIFANFKRKPVVIIGKGGGSVVL